MTKTNVCCNFRRVKDFLELTRILILWRAGHKGFPDTKWATNKKFCSKTFRRLRHFQFVNAIDELKMPWTAKRLRTKLLVCRSLRVWETLVSRPSYNVVMLSRKLNRRCPRSIRLKGYSCKLMLPFCTFTIIHPACLLPPPGNQVA